MKVALIGDVHANLPALEAVLTDAHQQGVEAIWNIGDFVGYGAFPDEVVKRLQDENALSIIGNYDVKVLKVDEKRDEWQQNKSPEKLTAFTWAYDNLSESSREYLRSLPEEIRMEVDGKRILLTHASPVSNEEHLGPDTPEERLAELAKVAEADIVICGHSHQPFKREADGVWFINTGSVGRPNDGDQRATYAVMQIEQGNLHFDHYRIEYDVEKAVAAIRENGLPEIFAQMVLQGRGFEAVKAATEADQEEEIAQAAEPESGKHDDVLKSVLHLAESCEYERGHTHQVTRLALRLFDELQPLHKLGDEERFWLNCAALLHDIGVAENPSGHHKRALRTILNASMLPFDHHERLIVGSIARYHRKVLPKKKHGHFAALRPPERKVVSRLAGILRVADGLDRTHQSVVEDASCEVTPEEIIVRCALIRPADIEFQIALDKGKLLEKVFKRKLKIVSQ